MTRKPIRGAKKAQGYIHSPVYASCGNCAHLQVSLPEPNQYGYVYVDQTRTCDIGQFKVALKAVCNLHVPQK